MRRSLPQGLARSLGADSTYPFCVAAPPRKARLVEPGRDVLERGVQFIGGGRRFLPNPFVLTLILRSGSLMERAPTPAFAVAMSARFFA